MIKYGDLDEFTRFGNLFRGTDVFFRLPWIAAGMVMTKNYRSGAVSDSELKNLSGMGYRTIKRSDKHGLYVLDSLLS